MTCFCCLLHAQFVAYAIKISFLLTPAVLSLHAKTGSISRDLPNRNDLFFGWLSCETEPQEQNQASISVLLFAFSASEELISNNIVVLFKLIQLLKTVMNMILLIIILAIYYNHATSIFRRFRLRSLPDIIARMKGQQNELDSSSSAAIVQLTR